MTPDMKRLVEAAQLAHDHDAYDPNTLDSYEAELIVRAVLRELREVGEGPLAAGSVDLIREVEDPWDAISPELQRTFRVAEEDAMTCVPAEELIRPNMRRAFTAMIDAILTEPTTA